MIRSLSTLADEYFDVIVIGGGIAGACTAWDASLRGLRVALLEREDFGGATSAHSLKVVHGGIRYLQHLDLRRVLDASRERSAYLRIAPHLVRVLPFYVPTHGLGLASRGALRAALTAQNVLTARRNRGVVDPERAIPRAHTVSRRELIRRFPELADSAFSGAGVYHDGQFVDPPRLILSIVKAAVRAGATAANYCEAVGLAQRNGKIEGVEALDRITTRPLDVRGRVVVNAAGPLAESLLASCGVAVERPTPLCRDMAVVVRRRLSAAAGIALQTKYRDPDAILSRGSRHLFFVPWREVTLIGVDSCMTDGPGDALRVTEAEVATFLGEINAAWPGDPLGLEDVSFVNAGLLPSGESERGTGNVSFGNRSVLRDHGATGGPAGLISVLSLNLTMGRAAAEAATDLVFRRLDLTPPACRTAITPVDGGEMESVARFVDAAVRRRPATLDPEDARRIALRHGTRWERVLEGGAGHADRLFRLGPHEVLALEVHHAVESEMALRLGDLLLRRTDLGTAQYPGDEVVLRSASVMAARLGWDSARIEAEIADLRAVYPPWQLPCGSPAA